MGNNENINKTTTDTLSEEGKVIVVGLLPIYAKPLTLLQVQELGEISEKLGEYDVNDEEYISSYVFNNSRNVGLVADAIVVALFRSKVNRFLLGWYVKKHLDTTTYKKCFEQIRSTFDFGFFFTSSVFLRGMRRKAKMENNQTAHGDSWVES